MNGKDFVLVEKCLVCGQLFDMKYDLDGEKITAEVRWGDQDFEEFLCWDCREMMHGINRVAAKRKSMRIRKGYSLKGMH